MILLSIDPGLTGALAWLHLGPGGVTLLHVADVPTAKVKQGRSLKAQIMIPALDQIIRDGPPQGAGLYVPNKAVIEEVHAMPGQGVTSMFRFGYVAGVLAGACSHLPTDFIRPQAWQKATGVKTGKEAGLLRAGQLFPRQAHFFTRKKDHNRADAVLIGYGFLCTQEGKTLATC